jgi:hypothetical protein
MPKKLGRLVLSLLGLAVSSCVSQRADIALRAKTSLVGRSKEEVLACMGAPPQHAIVGTTEVWSYPSGGDTTTLGLMGSSTACVDIAW